MLAPGPAIEDLAAVTRVPQCLAVVGFHHEAGLTWRG